MGFLTSKDNDCEESKERILLSDLCYMLKMEKNKGISIRNLCLFLLTVLRINWRNIDILEENNQFGANFEFELIKIASKRKCGPGPKQIIIEKSGDVDNDEDIEDIPMEITANKVYKSLGKVRNSELKNVEFGKFKKGIWNINEFESDKISNYWELFYLNRLHMEKLGKIKQNYWDISQKNFTLEISNALAVIKINKQFIYIFF